MVHILGLTSFYFFLKKEFVVWDISEYIQLLVLVWMSSVSSKSEIPK